jgi:nucleoside transporter
VTKTTGSLLKTRLATMMFFQYVIWGSWFVTLNTYLTQTLGFSGAEAGAVFGTFSLAAMVSPFFVGLVADRFFSTERVLAALYLLGAAVMLLATQVTSFGGMFATLLAFCLCYLPTVALTNSITMQNVADPGRDFPPIRTLGTLGWIVINQVVGRLAVEATAVPFLFAAGACVLMAVYAFTALPHTPPRARGQQVTARQAIGLDALAMLRDRSFLVFVIASLLACIPLAFYYAFTNPYLNVMGVPEAAAKMTYGQMSELLVLLALPGVLRVVNVRGVLLIGLSAWALRYLLLAFGDAGAGMWMFYLAIILHGVCYDFFFVAGYLYTDQEAPAHLRSTAQGFITFLTLGVGQWMGSIMSGFTLDFFTAAAGVNWQSFWLTAASLSFAITLLVLIFFRSNARIRAQREPRPERLSGATA